MREFIKRERPRRVSLKIPVTYSNLGIFLDSEIMNLSKGGVFLKADICLPLRSEVEFEFKLPGDSMAVRATGMVVWSRDSRKTTGEEPGMGVQFLKIATQDIEAILDCIEKLIRES